ncbi:hypothetical protein [Coleofasciculus sp. E2-BRE-01]|uniref:hypothetical protein n=1 Tax=Coleofasciculus sp. E2-BRE-01 TaxID=3069524 RepID=UPI0032F32A2E
MGVSFAAVLGLRRVGFDFAQPTMVAWHTLFGGLDEACSKGFSPLQLCVKALKYLLQTKPYFSCATPLRYIQVL